MSLNNSHRGENGIPGERSEGLGKTEKASLGLADLTGSLLEFKASLQAIGAGSGPAGADASM